jgi:AP-3 complex subunit delta-1
MSLLYECINGIIQGGILDGEDNLQERDEVASLCVGKLRGMIVIDSDPNRECSHPYGLTICFDFSPFS